jgi:hypothetical protein
VNEKRQALGDEREAYFPPKLKVFGPVGALTQSGTGAMVERSMTNMQTGVVTCNSRTDRQMC